MLVLIAAANKHGTIGLEGSMPWHNPEDLKHFRATTLNHKLLMGRKTVMGLPKKLDKRDIYVVTRNADIPNAVTDLKAFLEAHEASDEVIYVAGGGEIYAQCLPYAKRIVLSIIDDDTVGDTFFPRIDSNEFKLIAEEERESFKLMIYERE